MATLKWIARPLPDSKLTGNSRTQCERPWIIGYQERRARLLTATLWRVARPPPDSKRPDTAKQQRAHAADRSPDTLPAETDEVVQCARKAPGDLWRVGAGLANFIEGETNVGVPRDHPHHQSQTAVLIAVRPPGKLTVPGFVFVRSPYAEKAACLVSFPSAVILLMASNVACPTDPSCRLGRLVVLVLFLPEALCTGFMAALNGEARSGLEQAEAVFAFAPAWSRLNAALVIVDALAAPGDHAELERFLPVARGLGDGPAPLLPTCDRADGDIATARGDAPGAAELWTRSLEGFERLGMPYEAARTRELAARAADGGGALALLERLLEAYERIGAAPSADRVRAELAR